MINYFNYLMEANFGIVLLLLFYMLLLRTETDFAVKRKYLIGSLLIAAVFPIVKILVPSSNLLPEIPLPSVSILSEISVSDGQVHADSFVMREHSHWITLEMIYLTGVTLMAIRFTLQLIKLLRYARKNKTYQTGKYTIVETKTGSTFSFFNIIFIGNTEQLTSDDRELIIRHEMVHADKLHTLDVLLIELFKIAFWFNPFLLAYKKILSDLHEFQADEKVVEFYDAKKYCNLLARVALMSADFTIANHFNNSLTSKRITMMKTIKKKISGWKLSLILVTVVCFFIASCQEQGKQTITTEQKSENPKTIDEVFTVVEESASPAGGYDSLIAFIGKNLKYPDESRKEGKEGKVFVEFVVNTDGSLSDFAIKKGVDAKLDKEALRVVKLLPLWNPGKQHGIAVRQQFVLPISFKIETGISATKSSIEGKNNASLNVVTVIAHVPL